MKKYICIHGHFYQPPRENPWLEDIEIQDSAAPYRNWNERIASECYAPNAASRILDDKGSIRDIINNYSKMSFNFGPTLLAWLENADPGIYESILDADRRSLEHFSGHGAAIAQAYNHMIMPLANEQDKRTQVIWGIRDFEFRFKREPEGMWLPETAVDVPTLEILAEYGIKFTILAPKQARHIRKIGEKNWHALHGPIIDPQQPYRCPLPSGKDIVVFFYDGPVSHDIAFGGLLNNGEAFAGRLLSAFSKEHKDSPRLAHVATDGETFGHHHRFGNMALSYGLHYIESHQLAELTVYSEFLDVCPPQYEVEIHENSAWSCAHGVERWRSDCGCHVGHNTWHQKWRQPLREALDWLRDTVNPLYQHEMASLCFDPWLVRNEYIQVLLDRSSANVERFFDNFCKEKLSHEQKVEILKLLELQRHAMYMYTSCGWFFDDIAGTEALQILQYAARVIQLAQEVLRIDPEQEFIKRLESAPVNAPEYKNGGDLYRKVVRPSVIGLLNVGVHFTISSIFEKFPETARVYAYTVNTSASEEYEAGKQKLVVGKANIRSLITWEECLVDFSVIYFGDYNLSGGVRLHDSDELFRRMHEDIQDAFLRNDIPGVIRHMNEQFGRHNYSLWDLFKNEQGKVLNQVFDSTLNSIETHFREIYAHYYPLMRIRPDLKIPLPKALAITVEFILNRDLIDVFERDVLDLNKLERIAQEMRRWTFMRDRDSLGFVASKKIERMMTEFFGNPHNIETARTIATALRILRSLSLQLDLWKTQNLFFSMTKTIYPGMKEKAAAGAEKAREWVAGFENLGRYLKVSTA